LTDVTNIFDKINLTFAANKLHIISGPVGSGKTTLLLALLNEMYTSNGVIKMPKNKKVA